MLLNYFTLAYRNLQKNTVSSVINVLGLSLGMTAFVLIAQFVTFERSYNTFHKNLPTLFRLLNQKPNGEIDAYTAPGFAPLASAKISGIDQYCRLADGANLGTGVISFESEKNSEGKAFRENNFIYADANFFNFFTFPILSGNARSLSNPNVVALSRAASKRYFGTAMAIGKILTLNNQFGKTLYTVEAVYEDMPAQSDLRYDMVFSIQTLYNEANLNGNQMWASMEGTGSQWLFTYIKLKADTQTDIVAAAYTKMQHQVNPDDQSNVLLQPVAAMHLGRTVSDPLPTFGSLSFVLILSGIAALILAIAWFNYINLSTANALKRAKEVGIRKVAGASRAQLIRQFLGESALINMLAFVLSIALVSVLQGPYKRIIEKDISIEILSSYNFWVSVGLIFIAGTLASGAYTAFVLSSFSPSKVLKGVFSRSSKGVFIRKSLVVAQFSISLVLLACTIILFQQWKFMEGKNLGLNAEQLLIIRGPEVKKDELFKESSMAFESELRNASFVRAYCRSGNVPTEGFNFSTSGITKQNFLPGDEKINYNMLTVDDQYFDTYAIPFAAGESFTTEMCNKTWDNMEYVILNKKAAEKMGFASAMDAVGQKIKWDNRELEVRGVVQDYHHLSVKYAIEPIVFLPSQKGGYYTLKLNTAGIASQVKSLEQFYKQNFPGNPFEFQFLNDTFDKQYRTEKQYALIFTIASCLAIVIGCLGLFGLATYSVEQRTKEIGIRKVLGSSPVEIVALFSRDFLPLVVIALAIAVPISWALMNAWLQSFAYHIAISGWVFAIAGLSTMLIAWITVGYQAFHGAIRNPVTSLRSE